MIKIKYLIVDADFMSTGLRDEFEGILTEKEIKLTPEIWSALKKWVKKYSNIIPMDEKDRKKNMHLINDLDDEGIKIKQSIEKELKETVKIKYYSEGLLKYI